MLSSIDHNIIPTNNATLANNVLKETDKTEFEKEKYVHDMGKARTSGLIKKLKKYNDGRSEEKVSEAIDFLEKYLDVVFGSSQNSRGAETLRKIEALRFEIISNGES